MPEQTTPPRSPHQGYQVKDWCGHQLYDCDLCPWDTLDDISLMHRHQEVAHGRLQTMTAVDPRQAGNRDKE